MATIASLVVDLQARTEQFTGGLGAGTAAMEQFGAKGREAMGVYRQVRTPTEEYRDSVARLKELLDAGRLSQEIYNRAVDSAGDKMVTATVRLGQLQAAEAETAEETGLLGAATERLNLSIGMVAGFFAVGKITEWARGAGNAAVETEHLAMELGIGTRQTQELGYAATMTGTSIESLSTGMGMLLKNLGDLDSGEGKKARESLKALEIDPHKLLSESPAAALSDLAEAVSKIQNPFDRASEARALFGRGWQEMLPILEQGADGLARLENRAEQTGHVLSDVDLKTVKDESLAAANAGDALRVEFQHLMAAAEPLVGGTMRLASEHRELTTAVLGTAAALGVLKFAGISVGGAFDVESLVGAATAIRGLLTAEGAAAAIGTLTSAAGGLGAGAMALTTEVLPVAAVVAGAAAAIGGWIYVIADMTEHNKSCSESCYDLARAIGLFHGPVQDLQALREQYGLLDRTAHEALATMNSAPNVGHRMAAAQDYVEDLSKELEAAKQIADLAKKSGTDVGFGEQQVDDLRIRLADAQKELDGMRAGPMTPIEPFGSDDGGLGPKSKKAGEEAGKLDEIFQRLQERVEGVGNSGYAAFEKLNHEVLLTGGTAADVTRAFDLQQEAIDAGSARKEIEKQKESLEDLTRVQDELSKSAAGLAAKQAAEKSGLGPEAMQEALRFAEQRVELEGRLNRDHANENERLEAEGQLEINQGLEHRNRLEEEAIRIRESLMNATEKLAEKKKELDELVSAGLLTQAQENSALEQMKDKLEDVNRTIEVAKEVHGAYVGKLNEELAPPPSAVAGGAAGAAAAGPAGAQPMPAPNQAAGATGSGGDGGDAPENALLDEAKQQTWYQQQIYDGVVMGFGSANTQPTIVKF
jgi:hypothetical protein